MSTDNVIDFSSVLESKNKGREVEETDLIDHATEISEDLMNELLTIMVNDYDFTENFYEDTAELLFAFESIKSFIFGIYGLPHPLQELAQQCIDIEYVEDELAPDNDT